VTDRRTDFARSQPKTVQSTLVDLACLTRERHWLRCERLRQQLDSGMSAKGGYFEPVRL